MKRICLEQHFGERSGCGLFYDDAEQSTICPHNELNPVTSPVQILWMICMMHSIMEDMGENLQKYGLL